MKASEAQKRANKAFYESNKGRYRTISCTYAAEIGNEIAEIFKSNGIAASTILKEAAERLKGAPIGNQTPPDTHKKVEPIAGTSEPASAAEDLAAQLIRTATPEQWRLIAESIKNAENGKNE